jgi:hypothetical protein
MMMNSKKSDTVATIFVFRNGKKADLVITLSKQEYDRVLKLPGKSLDEKLRFLINHPDLFGHAHLKEL